MKVTWSVFVDCCVANMSHVHMCYGIPGLRYSCICPSRPQQDKQPTHEAEVRKEVGQAITSGHTHLALTLVEKQFPGVLSQVGGIAPLYICCQCFVDKVWPEMQNAAHCATGSDAMHLSRLAAGVVGLRSKFLLLSSGQAGRKSWHRTPCIEFRSCTRRHGWLTPWLKVGLTCTCCILQRSPCGWR